MSVALAEPILSYAAMKPWNDRLQLLEVIAVTDEAPDVKTFTFRSDADTLFQYKPGQFVTLELPAPGGQLLRTYTLSSSPSRPLSIAVTVKAQAESVGTRWMFENLRPGSRIKAYGPTGHFTHIGHEARQYLFISAGSGVTPMMSMLRWFADCAPGADIAFVTCARAPEEIIFRRELELLGRSMPQLALSILVKNRSLQESWPGHRGRLDAALLPMLVPDVMQREVFCCGPDAFMSLVQSLLRDAGFDMAHYHQESFGDTPASASVQPMPDAPAAEAGDSAAVDFTLSGVTGACQAGQTILEAARAAGVRIPAACESGICGTCKTLKLSGEVTMAHNGGILDEEVEEGYILACCSRPLGDVVVEA
ncbi:hybrid-cluster NAD(P)-dependent oxidoreductase [Novosphingobium terrae]|uniref:hybrid-cluster NAD(P)-dependent oxidoreductase n=1 Tax=Novosphingobium terrae TaxID=2726189 RepID=UPI001F1365B6|nr:hybrid-cluster NAD(P)-dependent oxidoreductase [Novosphingobium terrae]